MGDPRRHHPDGSPADPAKTSTRPKPRRTPIPPSSPAAIRPTDPILALQQLAGNRAVVQLLGETAPAPAAPAAAAPAPTTAGTAPEGLIVEDDVTGLRPEQMRRSEFVTQARAAAGEGLAEGAGPLAGRGEAELQSTAARYAAQSAAQLEAAVRRETAGAAGAVSAAALLTAIRAATANEARHRISTALPDEVLGSAKDVVANATSALAAVTGISFKGRDAASPSAGPGEVAEARAHLGAGDGVPSDLRGAVEQATGADLSGVRVHRAGPATAMAGRLDARAFTVGTDVVVGSGEPGPGTLPGDALLAHELAHAAQQSGGPGPAEKSEAGSTDQAETAADDVAVNAVAGLRPGLAERYGLGDRLGALGAEATRRIKLGLRLQRCSLFRSDPTKEELNKKVLDKMGEANSGKSAKSGVWYPYKYAEYHKAEWEALGRPAKGYADPKYWERVEFMHWVRKPGVSASAAMDAFFSGLTIADCASVAVAANIAALRSALGDDKFDTAFGGKGAKPRIDPATGNRYNLEISQSTKASVLEGLMRETESVTNPGTYGRRNVHPGELHYFMNHPDYPKRHPAGFWQGENAVYIGEVGGKQKFSGFGASETEDDMNKALVREYNAAPDADDVARRKELYDTYGPDIANWHPKDKKHHGEGPAQITLAEMLAAGGGFQVKAGQELDPAKVKALKDSL